MRKLKTDASLISAPAPIVAPVAAPKKPKAKLRAAREDEPALPSPARSLQEELIERLEEAEGYGGRRWSPRATLALAGGVSVGGWALIAWAIKSLF